MKNYYELLEVSEKASSEIIKKAYTTLVKKYHPDLQPDDKKKEAEEKIKEINEAYEILSNNEKREQYDKKLQIQKLKDEQIKYAKTNINNEYKNNFYQNANHDTSSNKVTKKVIRRPSIKKQRNPNYSKDYNNIINEIYNNAYNEAYNRAYNQAYINSLKNMGYEIKYEITFKEKIKLAFSAILTILVLCIICFILWQIPFIKNYFIGIYNDNSLFKFFIDLIFNIIDSFLELFK